MVSILSSGDTAIRSNASVDAVKTLVPWVASLVTGRRGVMCSSTFQSLQDALQELQIKGETSTTDMYELAPNGSK